ncbi:signal peptide peptidase SppA [Solibacillus sp. MA9]|uniref:Signal peptide peptidase SppA n=1 Tax=Solibacillus palustris TaxID=2908203 RepID=A0ABS9UDI9_9BACL|nr:signal peptide peptidase SppA [Solibacillus sp. MA9]MCH7322399.1 signal peptide peptidase SppA [Solibacillus sp. MA9]
MNTKRVVALIIAAVLLFFSIGINTIITIFKTDFLTSFDSMLGTQNLTYENVIESGEISNRIAHLTVSGVIQDVGEPSVWETVEYNHQAFMEQLDAVLMDDTVKAVLLSVDSPGGGVIESAEIHEKLVQIKEEKQIPIYVSMGSMAASGGYYISAPADKIFAQRETITGSIGVIMQSLNYSKLAEKVGIEFETIKSGAHKDMFGGSRPSTAEEKAMLQEMIDESYEEFVDIIEQGRGMSEVDVKKVADGRILGGTQALKAGLVDEIGNENTALSALRTEQGLEDAELFEYATESDSWASLLGVKIGSMFSPSVETQAISKIISSTSSPRMMYLYGEQ